MLLLAAATFQQLLFVNFLSLQADGPEQQEREGWAHGKILPHFQ
jgi:hypothetical protein